METKEAEEDSEGLTGVPRTRCSQVDGRRAPERHGARAGLASRAYEVEMPFKWQVEEASGYANAACGRSPGW